MKLMTTLATVALLWAGAVKANDFASTIEQAYAAAGYSNIVVQHVHGDWLVTGDLAGETKTFLVNRETGTSTAVDPTLFVAGNDGAGHDVGDDQGVDGAGHDVGDDNGVDGTGDDVGDDNGVDGAGEDVGDDNGVDGTGDDVGDDNGGGSNRGGSNGGGNSNSGSGKGGHGGSDD
jgi:hypothetical protein